jgi:NADH dehydrogenase/NADH:ubiquinone oxidoreductase subunit G
MMRYWSGSAWTNETRPKLDPPSGEPFVELKDRPAVESGIPSIPEPAERKGLFGGKKELEAENEQLREILKSIGIEQRDLLRQELAQLEARVRGAEGELRQIEELLVKSSDTALLQEVGIYKYHHPLQNSVEYKPLLDKIEDQTKSLVKSNKAVTATTSWTVNGSLKEGQKMVKEVSKLMLRAYVAVADDCIRLLKPSTRNAMIERLTKTRTTIAKLGQSMDIRISDELHKLKVSEIRTTSDFLKKREEEKEAERDNRARLREEEKVAREIAAEQAKLEKEKQKITAALEKMQSVDPQEQDEKHVAGVQAMRAELEAITSGLTGLTERAANVKAGHVYVISNVGSFGSSVIKIGMTRRLDPEDRVRELSDASVPFEFGIHALFFSNDAQSLETALHEKFNHKRVNLANRRREFFFATPAEVREALIELDGHVLEFDEKPDDEEYLQSEAERLKLLPPAI